MSYRTLAVAIGIAFVASILLVPPAMALRLEGSTVVIPVVSRTPGAGGSVWRTDLTLQNRKGDPKSVLVTFHPMANPSAPVSFTVNMPPYSVRTLEDFLLVNLGLAETAGLLILTTPENFDFDARARIFNTGNPVGEFGQSVPGIPLNSLRRQAFMGGLSGIGGNRLNVGVSNPTAGAFTVTMRIMDRDGAALHTEQVALAPFQIIQYNDIFTRFGIAPRADVQINIENSVVPGVIVYGYASVVRNDSGDAVFVFGTSPNS